MKASILALGAASAALSAIPFHSRAQIGDSLSAEGPAPRQLAWHDFDRDGQIDLFIAMPDGRSRLFRRTHSGLVDITREAGLDAIPRIISGAAWADFDRDGDGDLLIVAGADSQVLEQVEGGTFVPSEAWVSASEGLVLLRAEWGDVDGDAWPDLEAMTPFGPRVWQNDGSGNLLPVELKLPEQVMESSGGSRDRENSVTSEVSPATDESHRRRDRSPGRGAPGTGETTTGPGSSWIALPGGPASGTAGASICAGTIADQAGGSCVEASRVPGIDQLYPLSQEFNVKANGNIGMGTLDPLSDLHIEASDLGDISSFLGSTGYRDDVVVEAFNAGLSLFSSSGSANGSSLTLKEVGGQADNTWAIYRTPAVPGGIVPSVLESELVFAFGEQAGASANDPRMVLRQNQFNQGKLSINTDVEVDAQLHVVGGPNLCRTILSPNSSSSDGDSAELWLAEDIDGDFGVSLRHDGSSNQFQIIGRQSGASTVTAMTVNRASGRVGILTDSPNASLGVKVVPGSSSIIRGYNDADETVFRVTDSGRTTTCELEITGGCDLVEGFQSSTGELEPGTLAVIDSERPGHLRASCSPYDRRVAGIVSGANGVNHGIRMGQADVLDGDTLIAMAGRVWCKATTQNGVIEPGDRLTSSSLAGHAMRAEDARAGGAVVGKAMTRLESGTGLVLVLVNLQ